MVVVFNATFNNISILSWAGGQFYWWRKPEYLENTTDLPQVMYCQTLSHNVALSTPRHERDFNSQL